MTRIEIILPDALADEARSAGLLSQEGIESLLRDKLAANRIARMQKAREALGGNPLSPMTREEINEEISAYRKGQKLAAGP